MFENETYETILARCLARVPKNMDIRAGSIVYDAVAPACAELAGAYIQLDTILNETFADTASRYYLIKRAAERHLEPKTATNALVKGVFSPSTLEPEVGKRFSCEALNYAITEKISAGVYKLVCETAGRLGGQQLGSLIPINNIPGLETAVLTELILSGEDAEETEAFRQRYFESLDSQAFGGNISDYKEKTKALGGVGGVKVARAWNGGGTVKLTIINSAFGVPTVELVAGVQTAIDPGVNGGTGAGIAPIGHIVTVTGVTAKTINLTASVTLQNGWSWADVSADVISAIDNYYLELAKLWEGEPGLVIRISQLETRILNCRGVIDVGATTINGGAANITLAGDEIPIRGTFNGA
ncbi:MAG: baseplate J/gp47 family protein [Oscillospiraceae bacterium]